MGLYRKVTINGVGRLQSLAGANASGLPLGSIISIGNDEVVPEGYLKCDGSTFDETLYPALYLMLGSNKLPISYDSSSISEDPDIAVTNRSDYRPSNIEYFSTVASCVAAYELNTTGFTADGILQIELDDWYYVWIQDVDETIHGFMIGSRDNNGCSSIQIPIKKGQKFYGLNRNGTGTPTPSTDFTNADYTKIYVYYYHKFNLIKTTPGFTDDQETTFFNQVKTYVDHNTPIYSYDATNAILNITQRI